MNMPWHIFMAVVNTTAQMEKEEQEQYEKQNSSTNFNSFINPESFMRDFNSNFSSMKSQFNF